MPDADTNQEQLIAENIVLRQRIAALETAAAEHTQIEEALQASERRYRHLIEHSLGLLCIHDLDGILLEINAAAARALGYHPRDGVGKSLREFLSPAVQSHFDDYLERIRQHPSDSGLMRLVTRTGEERVWQYQNIRIEEPGQPPCVWGYAQDITDLLRTQQTLQASEERFRDLLEGSIQGVLIHRDFKPLFVNQAYARIHGYDTADDLLEMESILPLAAPHERTRWQQYQDARQRGEAAPTEYEYQAVRRDGSWIWIDNKVRVVTWEGAPAIQSTAFNITDRKQREAELRAMYETLEERVAKRTAALQESETRYRTLMDQAADAILIADAHDRYVDVNTSGCTMLGYTREELLGMRVGDLIPPNDLGDEPLKLATLHAGVPVISERQLRRKDGTLVPVEISAKIMSDGRLQSIVRDMTVRKQAEDALRNSEERFRQLVENSPSAIFLKDREGKFRLVNKRFEAWYGIAGRDVLGKTSYDIFPPSYAARYVAQDQDVLAKGTMIEQELEVPEADGALYWMLVTKYPIFGVDGDAIGVGTIHTDLTERKQAEDERYRLEAQLHQGQKMEALGTLAGGIAHEFNNMLAAILGFAQLASLDFAPVTSTYHHLQAILTAGNRAKELVQQILTFSHQSPPKRQAVSLAMLVQESLRLIRASIPATIAIESHIDPDAGAVLADPSQLHQLVMNLCTNADHAMRQTGGVLEVGVVRIEVHADVAASDALLQPGSYIRLTVQDTGDGIPPEIKSRIFEPFFTTKGIGEGTGMGLAIVHGIVASYGGATTVESRPGEGSTFTIYLPRIADAVEEEPSEPALAFPLRQGRILYVDDEALLVRLSQEMLESLGYEVVASTSSSEALDIFRAMPQRFDLVITDQTMPEMTGETLAWELRRIRADIPIVLCTGFSHVIDAERAQELGINAFCMKPIDIKDLAITIERVLGHQGDGEDGFNSS